MFENQGSIRLTNKMVAFSSGPSKDISLFLAINLHKPRPLTKEVGLIVKSYSYTLATHTTLLFIPTSCWVRMLLTAVSGTYMIE